MLDPSEPRDFEQTFAAHFQGMTASPTTPAALLDIRARPLRAISRALDAPSRAFLESVEREAPEFALLGLESAAELPGVRRKLTNLAQRSPKKRAADLERLTKLLARHASS